MTKKIKIAIINLVTVSKVSPKYSIDLLGSNPKIKIDSDSHINIVELGKVLSKKECDVVIYISDTYKPKHDLQMKNLKIKYLPTKLCKIFSPSFMPFTPQLYQEIKDNEYDIILTVELFQFGTILSSLAIILNTTKRSKIFVWQELDVFSSLLIPKIIQFIYYKTIGKVLTYKIDGFIPRSTASNKFMRTIGISDPKILPIVPTGVDAKDTFHPMNFNEINKFRNELNIQSEHIFLSVTTLDNKRGLKTLIKTAEIVTKRIHNSILIIKGNGPLKNNILSCIHKKNLTKNVIIIDRYLSKENLCKLYLASDVVVITTEFGLLPFVALEAMSCGKPVVSSFKRGLTDFIINGKTGFLVDHNENDLAKKIIFLLEHPEVCRYMGRASRDMIIKNSDFESVANKFINIFNSFT